MSWVIAGIVSAALFAGLSLSSPQNTFAWAFLAAVAFVIGGFSWGNPAWWRKNWWWGLLLIAAAVYRAFGRTGQ